jgi:hypothetical protein
MSVILPTWEAEIQRIEVSQVKNSQRLHLKHYLGNAPVTAATSGRINMRSMVWAGLAKSERLSQK